MSDNPVNPHNIQWWIELIRAIIALLAGFFGAATMS